MPTDLRQLAKSDSQSVSTPPRWSRARFGDGVSGGGFGSYSRDKHYGGDRPYGGDSSSRRREATDWASRLGMPPRSDRPSSSSSTTSSSSDKWDKIGKFSPSSPPPNLRQQLTPAFQKLPSSSYGRTNKEIKEGFDWLVLGNKKTISKKHTTLLDSMPHLHLLSHSQHKHLR